MHRICPSSFATTFVLVAAIVACVPGCDSPTSPDPGKVESAIGDACCTPGTMCEPAIPCGTWPPHVVNFGGAMVQHPKIVQVDYGGGSYLPEITASISSPSSMPSFYLQFVSSGVNDWLHEYDTATYKLGRGGFAGRFNISPSHNAATLSDHDIQLELAAQITAGAVPFPDDNTIYMVHFPSGKKVHGPEGDTCVENAGHGTACGYHGFFWIPTASGLNQDVIYGVLPDLRDDACATKCGIGTAFDRQTFVASHEVTESITDAEAREGQPLDYPDAVIDENGNGEISDICQVAWSFPGRAGVSYLVTENWSQVAGKCITNRPRSPSDILWQHDNGSIGLWLSGRTPQPAIAVDPVWQVQAVGDFDGDGFGDALWRYVGPGNNHGQLAIWSGVNSAAAWYPGVVADDGWQVQGIGDFDGDGLSDILWRYTNGQVAIWWSGDDAPRVPSYPGLLGPATQIKGVGDFDGDGRSDILWRDSSGQTILWWSGATARPPSNGVFLGVTGQVEAVGDFDGDGKADLYARNQGQITIYPGAGTLGLAPISVAVVGAQMQAQTAGDFDGNGKSDVFWLNTSTRQTWIWPDGRPTGAVATPVATAGWHVKGNGTIDP